MLSFLHKECIKSTGRQVYAIKCIHTPFSKGAFMCYVLKDFDQSQHLKTMAKKSLREKLTILHVPHIVFLLFKLRPALVK